MFKPQAAFSGFSVDDLAKAKEFYTGVLGLQIESEEMGLRLQLPGGGKLFIYDKPNHEPATFTVLNFAVDTIDEAVDALVEQGITFERYEMMEQDEKGIARGLSAHQGPDIAWFKDPAGNILAILQDK
ncbi:MAG TPA: VOC family protein [Candidatus Saccharimonadia bacterium]|nr:VOC family protein [Candidatus Saccharimonadia bacterium]